MDCWIPSGALNPSSLRRASRLHRTVDFADRRRSWRFAVEGVYLPRGVLRAGEDLRVRFSLRNLSAQEGTIYYIVNLRRAYGDHGILYSTDTSPVRSQYTACLAADACECIEVAIPWTQLRSLAGGDVLSELTLAVELEIWTPRRLRTDPGEWRERLLRVWQRGMFHKVQFMHNPILLFGPDKGTCFISYAWQGRPGLAKHEHRAWAYRLADAIALAGYRPVIDFNFLAPALVNREVIEANLVAADHIVIVYSDEYVRRRSRPETGVGFEWTLLSSGLSLWSKTLPIRRSLTDEEAALFAAETRFVMSFEEGDLTANTSILAHEIGKRAGAHS